MGNRKAWSEADDAVIRRLPAHQAAAELGRSVASVYARRHKIGAGGPLPATTRTYFRKALASRLDAEEITDVAGHLGKSSDAEVAKKFGVVGGFIRRLRQKRNVPACNNTGVTKSKFSDPDVSAMLGEYPDYVLAEMLGISQPAVNKARRIRGIPAYCKKRRQKPFTDGEVSVLGTDTDARIAEQLGRSTESVCIERAARHIPSYDQRKKARR
jgi:hypothetical protein